MTIRLNGLDASNGGRLNGSVLEIDQTLVAGQRFLLLVRLDGTDLKDGEVWKVEADPDDIVFTDDHQEADLSAAVNGVVTLTFESPEGFKRSGDKTITVCDDLGTIRARMHGKILPKDPAAATDTDMWDDWPRMKSRIKAGFVAALAIILGIALLLGVILSGLWFYTKLIALEAPEKPKQVMVDHADGQPPDAPHRKAASTDLESYLGDGVKRKPQKKAKPTERMVPLRLVPCICKKIGQGCSCPPPEHPPKH